MLNSKENKVKIEGIVSEVEFEDGTFTKNGVEQKCFKGITKVRVNQKINGIDTELEIPVHSFASQLKNDGTPNPVYDSLKKFASEVTSIAASDIDSADRVRITGASIAMNEYYGQNGNLVSFPRIQASFINRIKKEDCKPEATFSAIFVIGKAMMEVDSDGVETGKYKISGILPQYGGKIDIVPFIAVNRGVIDNVSQYWNEGDTVKATGRLNFSSTTKTEVIEQDFGEPVEQTRTINVSELIITGGSSTPMDGDYAFDINEIKSAIADRTARLAELKAKSEAKAKGATATAAKTSAKVDLGF